MNRKIKILENMIRKIVKEESQSGGKFHEAGIINKATELAFLYITNEREIYNLYSEKQGLITPKDAEYYVTLLKRYNPEGYQEIHELLWPKANPMTYNRGQHGKGRGVLYGKRQKINYQRLASELNNLD